MVNQVEERSVDAALTWPCRPRHGGTAPQCHRLHCCDIRSRNPAGLSGTLGGEATQIPARVGVHVERAHLTWAISTTAGPSPFVISAREPMADERSESAALATWAAQ